MGTITFDRRNVNESLQKKYTLPTYQREYKWTEKQFRELLNDLQAAFLENYKPNHGRKDVGSYSEYFLGTIITTELPNGNKSIIDGQQRLVTLTLILSYFQRKKQIQHNESITNIDNLIRRELYGEKDYNLSFEGSRVDVFNLILSDINDEELVAQISSIDGLDRSSEMLYQLYMNIDYYLENDIIQNLLPFFADYIVNKVMLFEIGVPSEQDAHRVFVTMNDRGLKLGPIDLLKGYLLSNILEDEANAEAHRQWMTTMNSLKTISAEEDSQFIKTWLRAHYAQTIRGKNRGDQPGDYELIGDSYHRWLVENKQLLSLNNSDEFQALISEDMPKYAKIYLKIKDHESNFKESMRHLYYNGSRNLTLQPMLIMASIGKNDTESVINKKIKIISIFLDIFATSRILNGQDNTYDNVRDPLFDLARRIRRKEFDELKTFLLSESKKYIQYIQKIGDITYNNIKRQDVLHLLARLASFMEDICNQTNSVGFSAYIDRNRATRTFDIEHILCSNYNVTKDDLGDKYDFNSESDYQTKRNSIGGLSLLPRGRNRSLKDKPYSAKLQIYSTENILCQTLAEAFFKNNPTAIDALKEHQIDAQSFEIFNKATIEQRTAFYKQIASYIWTEKVIESV